MSCTYTRTWPKYPDADISDRAAATLPGAATDAATNAAAAAVPVAAAAVAATAMAAHPQAAGIAAQRAAAAGAATCLQMLPDLPQLSDRDTRKWLETHCKPQPEVLLLLLRKNTVLFKTNIPRIGKQALKREDIEQSGLPGSN